MQPIPRHFFNRDTIAIAKALIGTFLIHHQPETTRIGQIVETEAYISGDAANHAYRGETKRNKIMFGLPGRWYIYTIYGRHLCLNVITGEQGIGEAVLIRALEPIEGIVAMQLVRQKENKYQLCNGPARLVQAFEIGQEVLGTMVDNPPLILAQDHKAHDYPITTTSRIGISNNQTAPLRFYKSDSNYISKR